MRKIAILFWHGLGDTVLFTPVLRQFKNQNPDVHICLAHLERLPTQELFSNCPYIDEFFGTSDPWNDFCNVDIGRQYIAQEAAAFCRENQYHELNEVTMHPSIAEHKIFRAAKELDITVSDFTTEIFPNITDETKKQADAFLSGVRTPFVFIHRKAGNKPKDLSVDVTNCFISDFPYDARVEYGSVGLQAKYLPTGNIALAMEILQRSSKVVCADSFIMHCAGAYKKPMTAIFTYTSPAWVIPLHYSGFEVMVISK